MGWKRRKKTELRTSELSAPVLKGKALRRNKQSRGELRALELPPWELRRAKEATAGRGGNARYEDFSLPL